MIVTYLRSSSVGTYGFCQTQYFINYVLGVKNKDNGKALMGSVMHKNLELLAKRKLADQNGEVYVDDDNFGKMRPSKFKSLEKLNKMSLDFYEQSYPGIMPAKAEEITLEWTKLALSRYDGEMDPRNQVIFAVEDFFEIEIKEPWATYDYKIGDKVISGQLGIKGTVDLIVLDEDGWFHIIDYKSGRRYNWATGKIKTYESLQNDKQLLLYYYALRNKYPDKKFRVSIYYVNDHVIDKVMTEGGVFTFVFDDEDYKLAESMIKKEFETIKNNNNPRPISSDLQNWKCKYLCAYSQIIPSISTSLPACTHLSNEIRDNGIDFVTEKYGDISKMTQYTGGGKINVELKND